MIPDTDALPTVVGKPSPPFIGERIDLATMPPQDVFSKELRRISLQGILKDFKSPDRCNFVESQLRNFSTDQVDFSRCDFKDNTIARCHFTHTKFMGASFALNTVSQTRFEGCNFYDTVIQNCEFYAVEFVDCDFSSLVIKDCVFFDCRLVRCRTSNKLFEMCLLTQCRFSQTELQLQTVTENFGLKEEEVGCPLRSDRIDHIHQPLDRVQLTQRLERELHPPARLSLHYYLTGDLLNGTEHLDAALEVHYWIQSQSTVGSFSTVLTRLCEFLLLLHERNELTYLPLLQLHAVAGRLAENVPSDARMRQAEFAVYGAFLSLTRRIEDYDSALTKVVESRRRAWTFLVEGKQPRSYYHRELTELFRRGRPKIVSLVPHNSPWEMALSFSTTGVVGAFWALFLATRTRLELHRIAETLAQPTAGRRRRPARSRMMQLTLGGAKAGESKSLVQVNAQISPTLIADFQLHISTRFVGKARRIMLAWLK